MFPCRIPGACAPYIPGVHLTGYARPWIPESPARTHGSLCAQVLYEALPAAQRPPWLQPTKLQFGHTYAGPPRARPREVLLQPKRWRRLGWCPAVCACMPWRVSASGDCAHGHARTRTGQPPCACTVAGRRASACSACTRAPRARSHCAPPRLSPPRHPHACTPLAAARKQTNKPSTCWPCFLFSNVVLARQ